MHRNAIKDILVLHYLYSDEIDQFMLIMARGQNEEIQI